MKGGREGVAAAVCSCSKCLSSRRFCSSWPWVLITEMASSLSTPWNFLIWESTFWLHLIASEMNFCFWSSKDRLLLISCCLSPILFTAFLAHSLIAPPPPSPSPPLPPLPPPPLVLGGVFSHWYRSTNSMSCSLSLVSSFIRTAGLGTVIGAWTKPPCSSPWVIRGITGSLCW